MALTEESKIDKIEVVGGDTDWVHVQVRTKNVVKRDGVKIADSYDRTTYGPAHDVSTIADAEVKAICQTVLTNARKTAYLAANPPGPTQPPPSA
tara:strand:- start:283 stop:564 length:282 start_codon:yes stop_codon:yes gene_type:complete